MDLKGILSISGYSGLFKLVSQTRNGIIVESMIDKKRMQAFATSKISALEDIAIYIETGDIPLIEVFKKIFDKENGEMAISAKVPVAELKKYFGEVLPDYDRERLYVSDMKRVISWYNALNAEGAIVFEEENVEKETTIEESEANEENK